MKISKSFYRFALLCGFVMGSLVYGQKVLPNKLIDNFSAGGKNKVFGTQWQFVTDEVMGGKSTGKMEFV